MSVTFNTYYNPNNKCHPINFYLPSLACRKIFKTSLPLGLEKMLQLQVAVQTMKESVGWPACSQGQVSIRRASSSAGFPGECSLGSQAKLKAPQRTRPGTIRVHRRAAPLGAQPLAQPPREGPDTSAPPSLQSHVFGASPPQWAAPQHPLPHPPLGPKRCSLAVPSRLSKAARPLPSWFPLFIPLAPLKLHLPGPACRLQSQQTPCSLPPSYSPCPPHGCSAPFHLWLQ